MIGPSCKSAVLNLGECTSTNSEAMRLARGGESGPLWVVASRQTEGRGRTGRRWLSAPGNLYASLLTRFSGTLSNAGQLSLVAGLGVFDAIKAIAERENAVGVLDGLWLKWPNDIMIGSDKCGGILVETSVGARGGDVIAVIGIGLNLESAPQVEGRRTTCLKSCGIEILPSDILSDIDRCLLSALSVWDGGQGNREVNAAFLSRTRGVGEAIAVHDGENVLRGTFAGLADSGHILVRLADGGVRDVGWGDVAGP